MIQRQTRIAKIENLKNIFLKLENSDELSRNQNGMSINREWNVKASKFAQNTTNPIRAIVEHLNVQPNPEKSFIPLSVGECMTLLD